MEKLKIKTIVKTKDSVTRTIRMSGTTFDQIAKLAEKNHLSFNNIVNQMIEYGLQNLAN